MKKVFLYILLFLLLFLGLQQLVVPKYQLELVEGSLTREYYEDEKNHQIIFIGDCEVYSNFSPITLFDKYGYTSYIRGNSQQLIHQSYHLLRETLLYEKPKIVVLSVNALRYGEEEKKEAYNRLLLDGMKTSSIKFDLIKDSMVEGETLIDYIFPIFRYHSRILELTKEDFSYYLKRKKISHNGYLMRVDVKPVTTFYQGKRLASYQFSKENVAYLDKIRQLCEENDIELILIKAPSTYPYWYEEYEKQIMEYASKYSLDYLNFYEKREEIGIDYEQDTYDAGLHLNVSGAEKLTDYFGAYLQENYELEDLRKNSKIKESYEHKKADYEKMKRQQYEELDEYGKIKMYGGFE